MLGEIKSPFLIFQDFISPLQCESIVDDLDLTIPDEDINGKPINMIIHHDRLEHMVYEKFIQKISEIEKHYIVSHKATTEMDFIWVPQGSKKLEPTCENSRLLKGNGKQGWARVKDRDLSCVLFLSDYCNTPNFDSLYEVYGGKLEFPTWNFGFNPERGTMIVYPSTPNFINVISDVFVGDLILCKFHISTIVPFIFKPNDFPGNYKNWFMHIA